MGALADEWQWLRAELEASERAEHPDVTDRFGRVWTWGGSGDLYVHDGTFAFPKGLISKLDLPSARLASNPSYSRLCDICRSAWSTDA